MALGLIELGIVLILAACFFGAILAIIGFAKRKK